LDPSTWYSLADMAAICGSRISINEHSDGRAGSTLPLSKGLVKCLFAARAGTTGWSKDVATIQAAAAKS